MTTIATDGHTMACDSQLTGGDGVTGHVEKIFQVPGGWLGVAGTYANCVQLVNWLKLEDIDADPPESLEDVTALLLSNTGVYLYEGSTTPYELIGPYNAIGSGAQAALAVMYAGLDPDEAVKAAAKVDAYTGGRIKIVTI